jgi:hypothetical protein
LEYDSKTRAIKEYIEYFDGESLKMNYYEYHDNKKKKRRLTGLFTLRRQ